MFPPSLLNCPENLLSGIGTVSFPRLSGFFFGFIFPVFCIFLGRMRRGDWGGGTALGPPLLLPPPQARRRRSGTSPSPNSRQGSGRGGGCAFWAIFRLFSLLILFPPPSAPPSPSALSLFEIQTLCVVCFFFNFPSESAVSFPFLIFLVFFFPFLPLTGRGLAQREAILELWSPF